MKILAAKFCAILAVITSLPTTQAWWDNGHMMVGQVATQLMAEADVNTINKVLSHWDEDFPNTGEITTAAIWPDQIKCTSVSTFCASTASPSISSMSTWHYIDLPLNVNGAKWGGEDPDLTLFAQSFGGEAVDVLTGTFTSMKTTKSLWSLNLLLRQFIHIFGDVHQPLHAVAGVSTDFPEGDGGGNSYYFTKPCDFTNLHALWDAAGGEYSLNDWELDISDFYPTLVSNATELISWLPAIEDPLNFAQYKDVSYNNFYTAMVTNNAIKYVVLDTYNYANTVVYRDLNLTLDASKDVTCPSKSYMAWAAYIAKVRIAVGGQRLAVILTQFAKQIRALGMAA